MNEKDIKALKWEKDRQIGLGNGLYLHLRKSSKTYIIRKRDKGKTQIITLGKHPTLPLREAKYQAMQLSMERDLSKSTVSELKEKFLEEVIKPNSKVLNQVEGYLNHIEAEFGNKKVIDITKVKLVEFIQKYSRERGARSADRMRSYLKQMFSYADELGYCKPSPMEGVTKRVTGYIQKDRERTLSHDEIKMVWDWKSKEIGADKTDQNVKVIKFLLLTGLRISEAQSGYIKGNFFRIDDTKGKHPKHEKRPHWVYLTDTARALLPLPHCTETNIQAWLKRKLINLDYDHDRFTPHDCRRTFSTMANDSGVEPYVVEKCLNHKMVGMMAVYNHAEYKEQRIECAKVVEKAIQEIIKKN